MRFTIGSRRWRTAGVSGVLLVGVAVGAQNQPVASAAVTAVGDAVKPDAVNSCVPTFGNSGKELFQTAREDGTSYGVPSDGVITSWSFHGTGLQQGVVTLSVFRHEPTGAADQFARVGEDGDPRTLTGDQLFTFPTRISVAAGDIIGLRSRGPGICASAGSGADSYRSLDTTTPTPVGTAASYPELTGLKIDVAAVVEPDVDGDGFGDETQDACPRLASTQAPCPIPNTTLTHKPANPTRHRTARFRFTSDVPGAHFQCKLGTHPYRTCSSPHEVAVRPGRHTFRVRARTSNATDPSPATYRWRVRR